MSVIYADNVWHHFQSIRIMVEVGSSHFIYVFFPFPRPLKRHHHARAMVTFTSTRLHLLHAPILPPAHHAHAQASPSRARKGDFYEPSSAVHTRVHSPLFPSTLKRYLRAHSSKCSTRLLHISAQV